MTSTPEEKVQIITRLLMRGDLDDHLADLMLVFHARNQQVKSNRARVIARDVEIGSIIRIGNVRPKMLNGAKATVMKISAGRYLVRLHGFYSDKWNSERPITIRQTHVAAVFPSSERTGNLVVEAPDWTI